MKALLFALARSRFSGWIIGWVFAHMSFLLPVDRLRDTSVLIAFYHPKPSYPVHILIVPKRAKQSITDLTAADADFMIALFETVKDLAAELNLSAYRLIVNAGDYQDVPQLHFHLVSE